MKTVDCYVTVRVEVAYNDSEYKDKKEAIQEAISECDYLFNLDRKDLKITETEICGIND